MNNLNDPNLKRAVLSSLQDIANLHNWLMKYYINMFCGDNNPTELQLIHRQNISSISRLLYIKEVFSYKFNKNLITLDYIINLQDWVKKQKEIYWHPEYTKGK